MKEINNESTEITKERNNSERNEKKRKKETHTHTHTHTQKERTNERITKRKNESYTK